MSSKEAAKEKDWREAVRLAQSGDAKAKERLLLENTGLIYMVLKRFSGRGNDMEELFQVGAIGLIQAIERFDLSTDYALSTYAVPMIIGEIRRFLRDDGMIHVSRQLKENASKIASAREEYLRKHCREPGMRELKELTGFSEEEIVMAMESSREVESIDQPVSVQDHRMEGAALTLADQIADERSMDKELLDRIAVSQMLESLEEQERNLIELRYMQGKTQLETAKLLGINQVAVSRSEKKILRKLRLRFSAG